MGNLDEKYQAPVASPHQGNVEPSKDADKIDNALNAVSVAVLFDMFALSKSATYFVLQKMHASSSFNAFLGEAFDSTLTDFIPDLAINPDNHEKTE